MSYCIFDAHCDTVGEILDKNKELFSNDLHFDIKRALSGENNFIQVFAAFVNSDKPLDRTMELIDKYYTETDKNPDIVHCRTLKEIKRYKAENKILSVLSVEGGDAVTSFDVLRTLYRLGVRIMTLTWNHSNSIADGIGESRGAGLTDFGKSVVREMNRLGMVVDVSHLSERGFWDVAKVSKKPFIASHSNAKSICKNPRNLTDEQIKEIIHKNGCIGINFYPVFLSDNPDCSLKDIIKHIEHILSLGGENNIGFGSDFDGVDTLPEGISGVQDYDKIINELLKLGYKESFVKKICSENFLRVLEAVFTE